MMWGLGRLLYDERLKSIFLRKSEDGREVNFTADGDRWTEKKREKLFNYSGKLTFPPIVLKPLRASMKYSVADRCSQKLHSQTKFGSCLFRIT